VSGYAELLVGLHRRFHDRLLDRIMAAASQFSGGRERVIAGTLAYLDGCREESGLRGLLASARTEPAILAEIARRNDQMSELIAPHLAQAGRARPAHSGRIWVAMAAEVALAESAAGTELPDLRAALIEFIGPES
jgi:hypothetical protein